MKKKVTTKKKGSKEIVPAGSKMPEKMSKEKKKTKKGCGY